MKKCPVFFPAGDRVTVLKLQGHFLEKQLLCNLNNQKIEALRQEANIYISLLENGLCLEKVA